MPADAKRNVAPAPLPMPLLYMRGDQDPTGIEAYLAGFRKNGVADLSSMLISGGHFAGNEAPEAMAEALREFRLQCDGWPPLAN